MLGKKLFPHDWNGNEISRLKAVKSSNNLKDDYQNRLKHVALELRRLIASDQLRAYYRSNDLEDGLGKIESLWATRPHFRVDLKRDSFDDGFGGEIQKILFHRDDLQKILKRKSKLEAPRPRGKPPEFDRDDFRKQAKFIIEEYFDGQWPKTNTMLQLKLEKWINKDEDDPVETSPDVKEMPTRVPDNSWFKKFTRELKDDWENLDSN